MRPRIVRYVGDSAPRTPEQGSETGVSVLRCVDQRRAATVPHELWVGVHLETGREVAMPDRARAEIEALAVRAQKFTPRVSLVPPDGLLLEVKGSLHLFNGTEGLLRAVAEECAGVGFKPALALAPTPLAAIVAARFGKPFVVNDAAQLVSQLSPLPLAPLRWPQDVVERLARMGVRTIGQTLRLPRAGFARRFGNEQLAELDKLTGRNPDLRHRFEARERFRRRRELTFELENTDSILGAMAPMLADLGKFLQARQCGTMELRCLLRHRHAPASECTVRLAAPLADVKRLTELLGDRLRALVLPEAVRSCELRSGDLVGRVLDCDSLWRPGEHGGSGGPESPALIERLRSRLGSESVYGLEVLAGHRPEQAWGPKEPGRGSTREPGPRSTQEPRTREPGPKPTTQAAQSRSNSTVPGTPWPAFRRPLWLLREPQLLPQRDGLPRRLGSLRLVGDPERIETGWWDGGDIERDYYKAFDIHGVQLWIFRERSAPHRWFLHGVFG